MKKLSSADATKILKNIKTFFFDCDGVLWNTFGTLPKAKETIDKLKALNKQIFFVTNNNTKSREGFLKKLLDNGFPVQADQVLSTSYLAAAYVKNVLKMPENKKVYMIGMPGLLDELKLMNINTTGIGPRENTADMLVTKEPDVGAVVVGYDNHFCLTKVSEALQYLQDPEIPFIVTNTDNRYPVKPGVFAAGTGVVVAAVTAVAERQPIVLGKPHKMFLEVAQTTCDIDPSTSIMIGDRLNTDIHFGRNCGFQTLCVLTGITSSSALQKAESDGNTNFIPDYFSDDLTTLCDAET
ncbi:glycerol-3-phosphate phosphatase-like isoform X1 [Clytia hemisphaerica]|uniref:Phosphoglycolate phosphatase n=2 Tax=Clytia hemisphaerica TaxID=252671 RepID=A0A7M5XIP6_9CNID